jgi:hypothetical protein
MMNAKSWYCGAPGGTRTPNLRLRSPLLYPIELQGHTITILIEIGFGNKSAFNFNFWKKTDNRFPGALLRFLMNSEVSSADSD